MTTLALTTIDAEITGGNVVAAQIARRARAQGWRVVVILPREGPLVSDLRSAGCDVIFLGGRRSFRIDRAVKLARILRRERVNILHTHDALPGTILARLAGNWAHVPVVSHAHVRDTLNPSPAFARLQVALNRWTSRRACRAVFAVSETVGREIVAQGVDGSKVRVIPNGVSLNATARSRATAREDLKLPREAPVVLHVGRLCKSKGQATLIRALPALRSTRAIAFVVGRDIEAGGAYESELRGLARELGVADRVHLAGFVEDLAVCYAAADVLVLPSTIEGMPLVLLEAMAAGLPVIASPMGGVPEVVQNGKTGLIVEAADADGLARAVDWVLSHPDDAGHLANAGRDHVLARHSLDGMLASIFAEYDQILRGS